MTPPSAYETQHSEQRPEQASLLIPAHNEEATIGRLLDSLLDRSDPAFSIMVVCNGCTDATADIARAYGVEVDVVEIAEASKVAALARGNELCRTYPRLYVDADVVIDSSSVRRLVEAVSNGPWLAVGPRRHFDFTGVSWVVRWYYDVWLTLPEVQSGLFGRGVIALSATGHHRVTTLPNLMSDDLAVNECFAATERRIADDAVVRILPPRTTRDLLRRRVRVATGNHQFDHQTVQSPRTTTSVGDLMKIGRRKPTVLPKVAVFLSVAVIARLQARRRIRAGDFTTWLRDDSSRA